MCDHSYDDDWDWHDGSCAFAPVGPIHDVAMPSRISAPVPVPGPAEQQPRLEMSVLVSNRAANTVEMHIVAEEAQKISAEEARRRAVVRHVRRSAAQKASWSQRLSRRCGWREGGQMPPDGAKPLGCEDPVPPLVGQALPPAPAPPGELLRIAAVRQRRDRRSRQQQRVPGDPQQQHQQQPHRHWRKQGHKTLHYPLRTGSDASASDVNVDGREAFSQQMEGPSPPAAVSSSSSASASQRRRRERQRRKERGRQAQKRRDEARNALLKAAASGNAVVAAQLLQGEGDSVCDDQNNSSTHRTRGHGCGTDAVAIWADAATALHLAAGQCPGIHEHSAQNAQLSGAPRKLERAGEFIQVVQLLLDAGASVDAKDARKRTPLHYAARANALPVATMLLAAGAAPAARARSNERPLHSAAAAGSTAVLELLLSDRACVNRAAARRTCTARLKDGRSALELAAEGGHESAVVLLLRYLGRGGGRRGRLSGSDRGCSGSRTECRGSRPNDTTQLGPRARAVANAFNDTALARAQECARTQSQQQAAGIREMLHTQAHAQSPPASRAPVPGCQQDVAKALHAAAARGHVSTTRVLLDACGVFADTNATPLPVAPQTRAALQAALFAAAARGHAAVVSLLLRHGVDAAAPGAAAQAAACCTRGSKAATRAVGSRPWLLRDEISGSGLGLDFNAVAMADSALLGAARGGHARCLELMMASRRISPFAAVLRHAGAQSALSIASSRCDAHCVAALMASVVRNCQSFDVTILQDVCCGVAQCLEQALRAAVAGTGANRSIDGCTAAESVAHMLLNGCVTLNSAVMAASGAQPNVKLLAHSAECNSFGVLRPYTCATNFAAATLRTRLSARPFDADTALQMYRTLRLPRSKARLELLRDMRTLYDSVASYSHVQSQCAIHRVIVQARCPYLAAAMRWQFGDHDVVAGIADTGTSTVAAESTMPAGSDHNSSTDAHDPVILEVPDLEAEHDSNIHEYRGSECADTKVALAAAVRWLYCTSLPNDDSAACEVSGNDKPCGCHFNCCINMSFHSMPKYSEESDGSAVAGALFQLLVLASSWLLPRLQRAAEVALLVHARDTLHNAQTSTHNTPVFYRKARRTSAMWGAIRNVKAWAAQANSVGASMLLGACQFAQADVTSRSENDGASEAIRTVIASIDNTLKRQHRVASDITCDARCLCSELQAVFISEMRADALLLPMGKACSEANQGVPIHLPIVRTRIPTLLEHEMAGRNGERPGYNVCAPKKLLRALLHFAYGADPCCMSVEHDDDWELVESPQQDSDRNDGDVSGATGRGNSGEDQVSRHGCDVCASSGDCQCVDLTAMETVELFVLACEHKVPTLAEWCAVLVSRAIDSVVGQSTDVADYTCDLVLRLLPHARALDVTLWSMLLEQHEHVDTAQCPVQHVLHERLCLFILNNFDAVLASPAACTMRLTPVDLTQMAISPIFPSIAK